ncbi:imidazole glycerol phosphate synthase subunit HisH [Fodinicola feengrottensis]|uniref:Imidazole glycerol phosphate synthase subunit HisH n=1 Tax=Fodinicola feengrottensis TaxID=435914 RepID=A0ABN2HRM4_9ACTN
MTPRVVVVDHGSGNLRSAERALARVGADVIVSPDVSAAETADGCVVPGVGAFAACMEGVVACGADVMVRKRLADDRPVLGICVGMQVMFARGDEHGVRTDGIGALPGEIRRLRAERVPHMGWNTVSVPAGSRVFAGVEDQRFYFVHSYAACDVSVLPPDALVTTTRHGEDDFISAVEWRALTVTQFHPEKSGDAGADLLSSWVRSLR